MFLIVLLFIFVILSPEIIPAASALWLGIVESTTVDTLLPKDAISIKYVISAKIILTNPPAATTAILLGMLAMLKEPSSSERSSSPSIFTNPPKGISLIAYFVSFPCFFHIVGPKPIANSFTLILHNLATKKCPPSCISTKNPNINIILKTVIKKVNK